MGPSYYPDVMCVDKGSSVHDTDDRSPASKGNIPAAAVVQNTKHNTRYEDPDPVWGSCRDDGTAEEEFFGDPCQGCHDCDV